MNYNVGTVIRIPSSATPTGHPIRPTTHNRQQEDPLHPDNPHVKFDAILTNPPFQDVSGRGKTPHKLWVDLTQKVFSENLNDEGILCQVSPSSFMSPDNKILKLFQENKTVYINMTTSHFFRGVGSTFADYAIVKQTNSESPTKLIKGDQESDIRLDHDCLYLPNDLSPLSLSIHKKVIFDPKPKLPLAWDFTTCHNSLLKSGLLSKERTDRHRHPIFHTNRQTWWSSRRQEWAALPKVMWTQSGYTKPFFDDGKLGGTDLVYYVPVQNHRQGEALASNLNLKLFGYIFTTAKWSGFGNKTVFMNLPELPKHKLDDKELFQLFKLTKKEIDYVRTAMG